jgi:hypothetical protein
LTLLNPIFEPNTSSAVLDLLGMTWTTRELLGGTLDHQELVLDRKIEDLHFGIDIRNLNPSGLDLLLSFVDFIDLMNMYSRFDCVLVWIMSLL